MVPLHFFFILQNNGCSKTPKGPPFTFFGTMRFTGDQKKSKKNQKIFFQFFSHAGTKKANTWHFEILLLFLSLRYGADLGRSRLVSSSNGLRTGPPASANLITKNYTVLRIFRLCEYFLFFGLVNILLRGNPHSFKQVLLVSINGGYHVTIPLFSHCQSEIFPKRIQE